MWLGSYRVIIKLPLIDHLNEGSGRDGGGSCSRRDGGGDHTHGGEERGFGKAVSEKQTKTWTIIAEEKSQAGDEGRRSE